MHKSILILIGVNLVLGSWLGVAWMRQSTPRELSPEPAATVGAVAAAPAPGKSTAAAKPRSARDALSWAALASPDLRKYAENLRRVGCPEETIKEIMLAEVNRLYAVQERALKVRPDDVAPWETAASTDRRSGEGKLRQLLEEKRNLLKELTGVDVGIDMPPRLAGRDVEKFEGAFGAVPEPKRDPVRTIQENYWSKSDDIKQRTVGYLEPEDRDEFLRIKTERHDALAKILTPAELQDYEMKTSDATPALKKRFDGVTVSDEELRKVFDFMQPLDDQYSLSRRNPDPVDPEFTAARSKAEKDVESYIKSVLGDDRFAEYQRSRDPAFRTINQIGSEAGLPKESIVQAYEAQQQVQNDSKRMMQDAALSPEQRAQGLQQLQAQAQQKMQQLFGDKSAQILQQLPGSMAQRYGLSMERVPVRPTP